MEVNAVDKKSALWNPWHGCHKLSEGCRHCYVYRGDAWRNIDSSVVTQMNISHQMRHLYHSQMCRIYHS